MDALNAPEAYGRNNLADPDQANVSNVAAALCGRRQETFA